MDCDLNINDLVIEILTIEDVHAVLEEVKPEWTGKDIKVKLLDGGRVNRNYLCHLGDLDDALLVRVIGTSLSALNRTATEIKMRYLMSKLGLGPRLYCTFKNGLCTQFINGKVYPMKDKDVFVKDAALNSLVAKEMAKYHSNHVLEEARGVGFDPTKTQFVTSTQALLDKWPTCFTDENKNTRFMTEIPPLSKLREQFAFLRQIVEGELSSTIRLCHNDVNPDNIVCQQGKDEVSFIDPEAMGFNPYTFDLAMFLTYISAGLEPDPEPWLLCEEFRHSWIRKYLCWKKEFGDLDDDVTDKMVEEVDHQQEMMAMAGNFFVGLILVHVAHNPAPEMEAIDFMTPAAGRFAYYFQKKDAVFAKKLKTMS